jgi:murein L,D-transpeptidase YcbB/YkuD
MIAGAGVAGAVVGVATWFAIGALRADAAVSQTSGAGTTDATVVDGGAPASPDPAGAVSRAPGASGAVPGAGGTLAPTAVPALLSALLEAHAALHAASDATPAGGLEAAYEQVFGRAKMRVGLARAFHRKHGLGRFIRQGQATQLAQAVVSRVRELDTHGLKPDAYDLPALEQLAGALDEGAGMAAATPGAAFAEAILSSPALSPDELQARLTRAPADLSPEVVKTVAQRLTAARGAAPLASDAVGDTRFFKALLQLALDFRFIRVAHPHVLRTDDNAMERDDADIQALLDDIVAASGSPDPLASLDPVHPLYEPMRDLLGRYRGYAADTRCEALPDSARFREDQKGETVEKLQRRLACEGYYEGPVDGVLAGASWEGLRRYQEEHDLEQEATVGEATIESLNVSMARRVSQIEVTLQRMRESARGHFTDYFVRVNIPAFLLTVYEGMKPLRQQRIIVGTNRLDDDKSRLVQGHINRTGLFATRIFQVIVNPTWILPKRVEEGELKSSIAKDPTYLDKQKIKKFRLPDGSEVFVQGSGDTNVLGKVKFLLEESNAVYLHDTDKRHLFKERRRDFSHGCMRVDQAVDFARFVLLKAGFDEDQVNRSLKSSGQMPFDLKEPINLVTEYMTVDFLPDGRPVFYTDIYGYDSAALNGNTPIRESRRWGHELMRPRWVPLTASKVVDEWRASGKTAPHDYKPDAALAKADAEIERKQREAAKARRKARKEADSDGKGEREPSKPEPSKKKKKKRKK